MTQAEFSKGWKLLILQPWGWRYRSLTEQGAMTEETKTQMEFYYAKLKWAQGPAWWHVAADHAQGEEWPSLNALNKALQVINQRFVPAIQHVKAGGGLSMDEALAEKPELLETLKRVMA